MELVLISILSETYTLTRSERMRFIQQLGAIMSGMRVSYRR